MSASTSIAPTQSPPPGCSPNYIGTFDISAESVNNKKRSLLGKKSLESGISLKDGVLTDSEFRIGYIAANEQLMFDNFPKAGAIWTAGFTVCQNSLLALGDSTYWYKCLDIRGSNSSIYFSKVDSKCVEVQLWTNLDSSPFNYGGPSPLPSSSPPAVAKVTSTVQGSAHTAKATPTTRPPHSSNNLPSGAKAGIGVGVGLAIVALGFLLAALCRIVWRRRRDKRSEVRDDWMKLELHGKGKSLPVVSEVDGENSLGEMEESRQLAELRNDTESDAAELHNRQNHELEGDRPENELSN